MSARTPTYKAILAEVARSSDRSSLFWWLVDHHDELIEQAAGKRMRWDALCVRFAEHGLTDTRGRPATPRTARETWFQARRTVAEARARKAAADAKKKPGDKYPSRISPDWRPQLVPGASPIRPAPSPARPADSSAPAEKLPVPFASSSPTIGRPGSDRPTPLDAPMDFPTVDADGNQLEEGMVFYEGEVRTRRGAEQTERIRRQFREMDWKRR